MKSIEELVDDIVPLQRRDLDAWIADALVVAHREEETLRFSEMECARVRLICTLKYELSLDQETLPLVLSLVDQLYETRGRLKALASAVNAQPPEIREAIMATLQRSRPDAGTDESG